MVNVIARCKMQPGKEVEALATLAKMAAAVEARHALADLPQLKVFLGGYIPGEEIFVRLMLYEILGHLDFGRHVAPQNVLFLTPDDTPGSATVPIQRVRLLGLA